MNKLRKIFFYSGLAIIALVETLDITGIFDVTGQKQDILIGISLVIASFIVELYSRVSEIDRKIEHLEDEKYINIRGSIASDLNLIIGNLISDIEDNLKAMIVENRFRLDDTRRFITYYHQTLKEFPNSTFFATSDLHGSKFWDDDTVRVVTRFTNNGGKLKRIFFLDSKEHSLSEEEVKLLNQQLAAGVEVYGICLTELSDYQNYLVESKGAIGWIVHKNPKGIITSAELNARNEKTRFLLNNFEELMNHPGLRKYNETTRCFEPT